MKISLSILSAVLVLGCALLPAFAADTIIKGVVTDNAGKPLRGAMIKVTIREDKIVTRFSQPDGRYEISVPSGTYEISAEAFGFAAKRQTKDTAQAGETNFTLTPRWDVYRLSSAEMEQLLPNDPPARLIKSHCIDCHDFVTLLRRRGQTAAEWKSFLPTMTNGKRDQPVWSEAKLNALSAALEKYFGPNAQYFGPDAAPPARDQVKHAAISDAALKATITEWTVPSGSNGFPHSIAIDSKRGIAWFSEVGNLNLDPAKCAGFTPEGIAPGADCGHNRIGRFDIKTEKFDEFPAPHPHTGAVAPDGRVWYSEDMRNNTSPNLAVIDPNTNEIKFYKFGDRRGSHTPVIDKAGNVWLSVGSEPAVWKFDVEALKFTAFKFPVPDKYPEDSLGAWEHVAGDPETPRFGTYHIAFDSKGMLWTVVSDMGMVVRIDPATGATKEFIAPGVARIKGIAVDRDDNVWFGAYSDHKIGKFDPKTETFNLYQPPTAGATPYGINADKRTGYIWYADQTGYNVTRFDPKTEQFVEYPLPMRPSDPRFIDIAPDGKAWFTDYWNGKIGVIDTGLASNEMASR